MNIVAMMGGLGNQMYQFSLGTVLAATSGEPVRYAIDMLDVYHDRQLEIEHLGIAFERASATDIRACLGAFRTGPQVRRLLASRWGHSFAGPRFVTDSGGDILADIEAADVGKSLYFHGYWQDVRVVARADALFWSRFRFPAIADPVARDWLARIEASPNPVAVHVRLGDYASNPKALRHHGLLGREYYENACRTIVSSAGDADFFVFSDQPDAARGLFGSVAGHFAFVDKHPGNAWIDMYLMASCRHVIIANSTYGWWAAWLNRRSERIVVAPRPWFADGTPEPALVPETWIRIAR